MNELKLSEIVQYPLPESQYVKEYTPKNQIVLHGTASGKSAHAVINYWNQTRERIATCVVIAGDGTIVQCYASEYWAGHIGSAHGIEKFKVPVFDYSSISIGVEICNWGYLTQKGTKFVSWTGAEVPKEEVIEYKKGFRGQRFYQRYTKAQIDSVEKLLRFWNKKYGIPLNYNEKDMWELSENAHKKISGIYTHNSFRLDKSDIHPQPEMIAMLKSLTEEIKK